MNHFTHPTPIIDLARLVAYFVVFLYPVLAVYHTIDKDWEFDGKWLLDTAQTMLLLALFIIVFITVCYYLWNMLTGWHYVVKYEMDPTSVVLYDKPKKKAGKGTESMLSFARTLIAMHGDETSMSDAVVSLEQMYKVDFDSVRSINAKRSRHLIRLSELMSKTRIYVEDLEDYEFVLQYIRQHCIIK